MLHVLTGPDCNNNCLFCLEADREARNAAVRSQSRQDLRAMIEGYPTPDEILFTSGEPTLNPDLLEAVGWAKDRGFKTLGLITNGRRLAYARFLDRLLEAGINKITVSIHGHNAPLHDGLTRTPGSFAQTCAGLHNLAIAKQTHSLQVHTSTVLNQRNLVVLEPLLRFLAAGPADQIVFNVMMPKGRGELHFWALMPCYGEVVSKLQELCATLPQTELRRLRVVDLPLCLLRALPAEMRGEQEVFDQYELLGSTGLSEIAAKNPCSRLARESEKEPAREGGQSLAQQHLDEEWGDLHRSWWTPRWLSRWSLRRAAGLRQRSSRTEPLAVLQDRITAARVSCDQQYYVTRRDLKDAYLRAKGPPCLTCALAPRCPGVWKSYVDVHGWIEMRPVAPQ